MSESEWTQVQRTTPKRKPRSNDVAARDRTESFGEIIDVPKPQTGKKEHRDQKLEWSASKERARNLRIEKRNLQRHASKKQEDD